jgi:hypothetical protein
VPPLKTQLYADADVVPVEVFVKMIFCPEQIFITPLTAGGFVVKLTFNCPSTFPESKRSKRTKENLKDVMMFFKL